MLKGLGLIISTSQHNAKPSTKDNIMEPNRNLDLLRIIQQQHQVRKLAKEISEKPENPHPKTTPVFIAGGIEMGRTKLEKIRMSEFVNGIIKGIQFCTNDSHEILEDHWITWDNQTDINIWNDDEGFYHACAYDVIDGKTETEHWTELDVSSQLFRGQKYVNLTHGVLKWKK